MRNRLGSCLRASSRSSKGDNRNGLSWLNTPAEAARARCTVSRASLSLGACVKMSPDCATLPPNDQRPRGSKRIYIRENKIGNGQPLFQHSKVIRFETVFRWSVGLVGVYVGKEPTVGIKRFVRERQKKFERFRGVVQRRQVFGYDSFQCAMGRLGVSRMVRAQSGPSLACKYCFNSGEIFISGGSSDK